MKVYIAGPMTGHPAFNFPVFDTAVALIEDGWKDTLIFHDDWEAEGLEFKAVSPAELDDPETRLAALASPDGAPGSGTANGETWGDFLARDVKIIADEVDGVVLLPGWETSKGARLEAFICRHVGKPVFYLNDSIMPVPRDDWPEGAVVEPEQLSHNLWPEDDVPPGIRNEYPGLIELDHTELDAFLTLGDLEALFKIDRDRHRNGEGRPTINPASEAFVTGVAGRNGKLPLTEECIEAIHDAIQDAMANHRAPEFILWGPPLHQDMPQTIFGLPVGIDESLRPGEWRLESVNLPPPGAGPETETLQLDQGGEVRITSETGGQKGRKPERLDLVPPEALWELARVYGFGAEKYDDHNYLKGYDWSLSYGALLRHVTQSQNGQELDEESGLDHLAHAAWHCFALLMFKRHGLGTDDRLTTVVDGLEPETTTRTGRSEEARRDPAESKVPYA